MIDEKDRPCSCKIEGKQFDENDKTCIECKKSQKILEMLLKFAIKKAVDDGDMRFLEMLIDAKQ